MNRIPKTKWPCGPTRWIIDRVLYVSIPFTWNLTKVRAELMQRNMDWDRAVVGGPATRLMPGAFSGMPWVSVGLFRADALQRINPMATRTTIGCVNRCGFCGVPRIEPKWSELSDWPDLPILMDNNLLAASDRHFDKVMDRLEKWGWCDFNQGLDCRLLNSHHAERIGRIKGAIVRLALDADGYTQDWLNAAALLKRYGTAKGRIRTYVLCGFNDSPANAKSRCETVETWGALPLPQWFHELNATTLNAVTAKQAAYGWTASNRTVLMRHYYRHTDGNGSHQ